MAIHYIVLRGRLCIYLLTLKPDGVNLLQTVVSLKFTLLRLFTIFCKIEVF